MQTEQTEKSAALNNQALSLQKEYFLLREKIRDPQTGEMVHRGDIDSTAKERYDLEFATFYSENRPLAMAALRKASWDKLSQLDYDEREAYTQFAFFRAINTYKPHKGFFTTHLYNTVPQLLLTYLKQKLDSGIIHIPAHRKDDLGLYMAAREQLINDGALSPTFEQVVPMLEFADDPRRLKVLSIVLQIAHPVRSLDEPYNSNPDGLGEGAPLHEFLPGGDDLEKDYIAREERDATIKKLKQVLSVLSPKERTQLFDGLGIYGDSTTAGNAQQCKYLLKKIYATFGIQNNEQPLPSLEQPTENLPQPEQVQKPNTKKCTTEQEAKLNQQINSIVAERGTEAMRQIAFYSNMTNTEYTVFVNEYLTPATQRKSRTVLAQEFAGPGNKPLSRQRMSQYAQGVREKLMKLFEI
ncbi:hypothetical protein HGA88_04215 [Candidatus Roizmanbacteria bacterium]|nr:hypothetical protein [Candidatus Roizmanbacteria bacterium]